MVEYEYAKALFELAHEEDKIDLFMEYLDAVLDISSTEKDFFKIMASPVIEIKAKAKIVEKAFGSFDSTFLNFLKVLVQNQRFDSLVHIRDEYVKLLRKHNSILKVEVISSIAMSKPKLKQIEKSLEIRYPGKELHIENKVNPKILGGMQIICGGESFDMTLKNQLTKIKESL